MDYQESSIHINDIESINERHFTLMYKDPEKPLKHIARIFKDGLANNEKCIYIANDNPIQHILDIFHQNGIDTDKELESERLIVFNGKEVLLDKDNMFNQDKALNILDVELQTNEQQGFNGLRSAGEMSWILNNEDNLSQLFDYEVNINAVAEGHKAILICMYNIIKFPLKILLHAIYTHPVIIYGDKIKYNDKNITHQHIHHMENL
jgi:two-component system, chemotaxis family, sensor kinase Cph1